MIIPIYQVDAFTSKVFGGNPAAVCPLQEWISDNLMQKIAQENNLSETAFFVKNKNEFDIRWFTPLTELDLAGHPTLATAHVILKELDNNLEKMDEEINYQACDDRLCIFRSELITIPLSENFTSIEKKLDKNSILKSKELLLNIKNKDSYTSKGSENTNKNSYLKIFLSQNVFHMQEFSYISQYHQHVLLDY